MKAPLIHVASLIFNEPLAIYEPKLQTILQAIGPRLVVDDQALEGLLREHFICSRPVLLNNAVLFGEPPAVGTITTGGSWGPAGGTWGSGSNTLVTEGSSHIVVAQPSAGQNGVEEKPYRLTPEGVAVIPVRGTLLKRFSFLSAASGLTSYAGLAQATSQALADSQVRAVLFDIDSPGGTTHGCFELSDAIYGMRGDKPMWACANDLAASAAYALASAVDRIWVTRTGGVGSVGVFALHAEQSGADEQAGVKYTYIYAGDKKVDGNPHEPLSKSAKSDIQAEVDRENVMFLSTVARNRGVSPERIFGLQASVLFGGNAMPLLADEVGTYDDCLAALTEKVNGSMGSASGKVALKTEAGNNALQQGDQKKEGAMAEDLKAANAEEEVKTAAAAPPQDDEDDDDKPEEDQKPSDEAKKPKAAVAARARSDKEDNKVVEMVTANSAAKKIASLCQLAGAPELTGEYIVAGHDVDKVMELLSERRVKASAEGTVNSYVENAGGAVPGSRASIDAAIKQARLLARNAGEPKLASKHFEAILRDNPEIYAGYLEEKDRVMAQCPSGTGKVLTEYIMNNQRRYMAALNLGTAIESMPGGKGMI